MQGDGVFPFSQNVHRDHLGAARPHSPGKGMSIPLTPFFAPVV